MPCFLHVLQIFCCMKGPRQISTRRFDSYDALVIPKIRYPADFYIFLVSVKWLFGKDSKPTTWSEVLFFANAPVV